MHPRRAILALAGGLGLAAVGAGAMAQAAAERRLDAAIERLRASLGPDARISWGQRQVDPVSGSARFGDLLLTTAERRVTIAEALFQEVTETQLGRAELRGLLMTEAKGERAELARLVVGGVPIPGPAPGGGFDLARFEFKMLEAEALRATSPEGSLSFGRVTAEGYLPGALGQATAEAVQYQGTGSDRNAFRLGRLAITGLVMPAPGQDLVLRAFAVQGLLVEGAALTDPDKAVDVEIGRLALSDWVPGRLTDIAAEGLRLGAPFGPLGTGTVRMGRLAIRGIDMADTVAAMFDGAQPPSPAPGARQTLLLEGISAETAGQPLFRLGRMLADGDMAANGDATGGIALEGLEVTLPRGTVPWLEQVGYPAIAGSLEIQGRLQREGGVLDIAPWRTSWAEAGTLTIGGRFLGLPVLAPGAVVDDAVVMQQLLAARLGSVTLTWREQGLLGRVLAWQARGNRVPEARIREQWAQAALAMPLPGAPPPRGGAPASGAKDAAPDAFAPIREAIASFIRQPREIEVALRPARPFPVSEMAALGAAGPVEIVRLLGITVQAR
jgi:hypothetical protein